MKKKAKLSINDLTVESFVTSTTSMKAQTPLIKGGYGEDDGTGGQDFYGNSPNPLLCSNNPCYCSGSCPRTPQDGCRPNFDGQIEE